MTQKYPPQKKIAAAPSGRPGWNQTVSPRPPSLTPIQLSNRHTENTQLGMHSFAGIPQLVFFSGHQLLDTPGLHSCGVHDYVGTPLTGRHTVVITNLTDTAGRWASPTCTAGHTQLLDTLAMHGLRRHSTAVPPIPPRNNYLPRRLPGIQQLNARS